MVSGLDVLFVMLRVSHDSAGENVLSARHCVCVQGMTRYSRQTGPDYVYYVTLGVSTVGALSCFSTSRSSARGDPPTRLMSVILSVTVSALWSILFSQTHSNHVALVLLLLLLQVWLAALNSVTASLAGGTLSLPLLLVTFWFILNAPVRVVRPLVFTSGFTPVFIDGCDSMLCS